MQRLFVLVLGDGVGDDAGADVEGDVISLLHGGADGDVPLAAAVEAEPADGAGVEAAGVGLELGDDFAGTLFGGAGDAAAGEAGAEGIHMIHVRAQGAGDGGDEVEDLGVAFDTPELGDGDAAKFTDLAEVVALQVGDHEQLGALFHRRGQLAHGGAVARGVIDKAGARPFDGTCGDAGALHAEEELGGGRQYGGAGELHEGGVRRGGDGTEFEIEGQRIGLLRPVGAPGVGEVYLIDVSGGDVALRKLHHVNEVSAAHSGLELQARRGGRHRDTGGGLPFKIAKFIPAAAVVPVNEAVRVDAKDKTAIITYPAV